MKYGVVFVASAAMLSGPLAAGATSPYALFQVDTDHVASLRSNGAATGLGADRTMTDVRRATVGLEGEHGDAFAWEAGYDFKMRALRDIFATIKWRGVHSVTIGQFKQPVLMDELSSSRTADFIASSTIADVFAVSRRVGVSYAYRGKRAGAVASVHGRELGDGGDKGRGVAARVFGSPRQWRQGFLHLGASLSTSDREGPVRYRVRPNADLLSLRFIDARTDRLCLACEARVDVLAPEIALVHGPWKFQSELVRVRARQRAVGNDVAGDAMDAQGGYVSLLWMPGTHRWSYRDGLVATPRPASGTSLWQLGVRHDWIALDPDGSEGVGKSTLRIATAGVNWYVGPRWKVSVNVVDARARRAGPGQARFPVEGTLIESRVQFAW